MKYLIILSLFMSKIIFAQFNSVNGRVFDSDTKKPLPNANIIIARDKALGTSTKGDGKFILKGEIKSGDILVVSYIGYDSKKIKLTSKDFKHQLIIKLIPEIIPSQTVLVQGSLGKEGVTPLTFTKIKRKDIEENYTVQDIPKYLSSLPSTTFYSENGNGIGYNYLTIRGFDQRRISVSINGIPQNDPEDHNVYWLDFPDLLASTQVIQVQRGAGSGVFGYPAIGGSINIITSTFSDKSEINFSASLGSYNTRKYSASLSSGIIDKKYSLYAKFSQILSSGYRNLSWVKFNSYYLSAVRYDKNLTTQINLYGGPIQDGLSYTGLPKFAIKNKNLRRSNYSYWEADKNSYTYTQLRRPSEIENFTQPHYELLNELKLTKNLTLNSALFLVTGNGFFDYDGTGLDTTAMHLTNKYGFHPTQNPSNLLINATVDNTQFGWIPRLSYKHGNGELIVGAEFRKHKSTHLGTIAYGSHLPEGLTKSYHIYYFNGGKDIINGFVHESYKLNDRWNFLGEVQLAYHKYKFYNEKYINTDFSIDGLYFNPRFGINYKFNKNQNVYFSYARVTREPRLSTYYSGEESIWGSTPQFKQNTNGSYNFNQPYVKPETMNDFEIGSSLKGRDFNLSLNLYYMLFNNEIVPNGKVDIFGQPITGNFKATVHQGIEISAAYKATNSFEVYANATYSHNKITNGNYFIDATHYLDLSGNKLSGFPDFLANINLTYNNNGVYLQLTGKYVGSFYSDNYGKNLKEYLNMYPGFVSYTDNKNDAYFTADFTGSYQLNIFSSMTPAKIIFQVNNIFDNLYSANAIGAEFFPAAERNFLFGVKLGL